MWVFNQCVLIHKTMKIMRVKPMYDFDSQHLESSRAHNRFSVGTLGKWIPTQFCFSHHVLWNKWNCPLLLHHFSLWLYIFILSFTSPALTARYLTTMKARSIYQVVTGGRWFTCLALKFPTLCKVNECSHFTHRKPGFRRWISLPETTEPIKRKREAQTPAWSDSK